MYIYTLFLNIYIYIYVYVYSFLIIFLLFFYHFTHFKLRHGRLIDVCTASVEKMGAGDIFFTYTKITTGTIVLYA